MCSQVLEIDRSFKAFGVSFFYRSNCEPISGSDNGEGADSKPSNLVAFETFCFRRWWRLSSRSRDARKNVDEIIRGHALAVVANRQDGKIVIETQSYLGRECIVCIRNKLL